MLSVHFFSDGRRKRMLLPYTSLAFVFYTDPDTIIIPFGVHELRCKFTPPGSEVARRSHEEAYAQELRRITAGRGPSADTAVKSAEDPGLGDDNDGPESSFSGLAFDEAEDAWERELAPSPSPVLAAALAAVPAHAPPPVAPSESDAPPSATDPETIGMPAPVPESSGQNVGKFLVLLQDFKVRALFSLSESGMTVRVFRKSTSSKRPDVEL